MKLRACIALLAPALLIAGCSQPEESGSIWDEADQGQSADQQPENNFGFQEARRTPALDIEIPSFAPPPAAPGISVTAAPGVAFTYRYAFVLGSDEIAGQQEEHAQACEELGREKCRITGMRYKLIDENRIEAYLQFKLAPELAREFGKDGISSIEDAGGKLIEAIIVGTDAADQIEQSRSMSESLEQRIEALERRVRDTAQGSSDRAALEAQIRNLQAQLEAQSNARESLAESLANTPMTYYYRSDEGFTLGSNPIGDAGSTAWFSFSAMIAGVLTFLGIVLPWLLLGLGLLAIWRTEPVRKLRNWVRPSKKPETFGDVGDRDGNAGAET